MNSKRAYARSAHARGKRYFVYSQWGKGCCSFSFSCLPAIMAKIVLNVCYHFCAWNIDSGANSPLFYGLCYHFCVFCIATCWYFWNNIRYLGMFVCYHFCILYLQFTDIHIFMCIFWVLLSSVLPFLRFCCTGYWLTVNYPISTSRFGQAVLPILHFYFITYCTLIVYVFFCCENIVKNPNLLYLP